RRWTTQLRRVGAAVDCFDFTGLVRSDGQAVCDLNDFCSATFSGGRRNPEDFAMIDRIKPAEELPQYNGNGSSPVRVDRVCTPGEIGELCALARRYLPEMGETSPNSPPGYNQRAVYPEDSILTDWMWLAREQVESADAFIIGSILPVCAARLGRRIYFQWGEKRIFPNCFNMLAGKPGD